MNLRSFVLFLFLITSIQTAVAQFNYSWSNLSDGTSGEYGNYLLRDQSGNSILVGSFTGTLYLGQGASIDTVENVDQIFNSQDIYIQSISPSGEHNWVKSIGVVDFMIVNDVFVQPVTGNIVLCGNFEGQVDFDPGTGVVNRSPMTNFSDAFVLTLDSLGNYVNVMTLATPMSNVVRSMAPCSNGNYYIAGVFTDSIDLDPGISKAMFYTTSWHSYLAKYDVSGALLWAKQFQDQELYVESIRTDDNVINVISRFTDTTNVAFAPASVTAIAEPYSNSLLSVNYDTNGSYLNHIYFDMLGNTAAAGGSHTSSIYAHSISPNGEIYLGTSYGGQLRLDSNQVLSSPQAYRALAIKLSATNQLEWAREFGGLGGANNAAQDRVEVIDFYEDGTLLVAGSYTGPEDMDPTNGVRQMGVLYGGLQGYVAKWGADGSFIDIIDWEASISSSVLDGYAYGNETFVCGVYRGWMDMDFGQGVDLDTAFSLNAHVIKLGCDFLTLDTITGLDSIVYQNQVYTDSGQWVYDTLSAVNMCDSIHGVLLSISADTTSGIKVWENSVESGVHLFPNPTKDRVKVVAPGFSKYTLYSISGSVLQKGVLKDDIDLSNYPDGIYLIRLESSTIWKNLRVTKSH